MKKDHLLAKLTVSQEKVYFFIKEFYQAQGRIPSYRKIAQGVGLNSVSTVAVHIKHLIDKGYLRKNRVTQALTLVVDQNMSADLPVLSLSFLPLVGVITAGQPIEAITDSEPIAVPADLIDKDHHNYVLKVKGDSMIDDGILDKDFVIVEQNYYPNNGDIVVALLDNAYATLKRYYKEKALVRLQPANKAYQPILTDNPSIQGVVKGVYRKL